jgi:hypothetical protein
MNTVRNFDPARSPGCFCVTILILYVLCLWGTEFQLRQQCHIWEIRFELKARIPEQAHSAVFPS